MCAKLGKFFLLLVDIVWCYLTKPLVSLRNTGIILIAFWRTFVIGRRADRVMKKHEGSWPDRIQSRYIWRVAKKFWGPWILKLARITLITDGLERFDGGPFVVVANHSSALDILVATSLFPNCRFVAKKEVLSMPVIGNLTKRGGQAVIDRDDKEQAMSSIRENVRNNPRGNILVFPEGTRTKTGELGMFKYGAFAIAKENNLPILSIAIGGAFKAQKSKINFLHLLPGSTITVSVCPPIPRDEVARFEVPILAERARSMIAAKIEQNINIA